jgi:hypothetical protein
MNLICSGVLSKIGNFSLKPLTCIPHPLTEIIPK